MISKKPAKLRRAPSDFGQLAAYITGHAMQPGQRASQPGTFADEASASSFGRVASYITGLGPGRGHKKREAHAISCVRITNCHADDVVLAVKEIKATQALNKRAKGDKTYHLIISFREEDKEKLTDSVLCEIEKAFCDALGYSDHQRISAVHTDTDNLHLHLSINKVHPERLTCHDSYNDYYVRDSLCRELEKRFQLSVDKGVKDRRRGQNLPDKASALEKHSGLGSFASWVRSGPRDALKAVLTQSGVTWEDVHRTLARYDLTIRKRGAGFVLSHRTRKLFCKASAISREASKEALEQRLGPYREPTPEIAALAAEESYTPRPLHTHPDREALYQRYLQAQAENRLRKSEALSGLKEERVGRLAEIKAAYQKRRLEIIGDNLVRKAAKRKLHAANSRQRREAIARVEEGIRRRRQETHAAQKSCTWQEYLIIQAMGGDEKALAVLRSSKGKSQDSPASQALAGDRSAERPLVYPHLKPEINKTGQVLYQVGSGSIRDDGSLLHLDDPDDQTIVMGLRMAQQKFGSGLKVEGGEIFRVRVVQIAVSHKMEVTFLDPQLEAVRQSLGGPLQLFSSRPASPDEKLRDKKIDISYIP